MSDENEQIKRITFENQIPIMLILNPNENQCNQEIFPLLLMIPRVHYISLYFDKIHNYFMKFLNNIVSQYDLYLTYNNLIIDCNIFFGVFFDHYFYEYSNSLPIKVIVNYRLNQQQQQQQAKFQFQQILMKQFKTKDIYTHDLKQSSAIKYKNSARQILFDLQSQDYDSLWESFIVQNYSNFNQIWLQIWDNYQNKQLKVHQQIVPLRIYLRGQDQKIQLQYIIQNQDDTIRNVLYSIFPDIFDEQKILIKQFENMKIISHGIELEQDMKIKQFYDNFYYFDGFAYLVIIM